VSKLYLSINWLTWLIWTLFHCFMFTFLPFTWSKHKFSAYSSVSGITLERQAHQQPRMTGRSKLWLLCTTSIGLNRTIFKSKASWWYLNQIKILCRAYGLSPASYKSLHTYATVKQSCITLFKASSLTFRVYYFWLISLILSSPVLPLTYFFCIATLDLE